MRPGTTALDCHFDAGVAVARVTSEVNMSASGLPAAPSSGPSPMGHGHGPVVNLASVTFIDTAVIGVLARIWHRVRASHGSLALAMPARQVQRVLDSRGLADAFSV